MIFAEPHTVDTDAAQKITNDTGKTDLLLGRGYGGRIGYRGLSGGQHQVLRCHARRSHGPDRPFAVVCVSF